MSNLVFCMNVMLKVKIFAISLFLWELNLHAILIFFRLDPKTCVFSKQIPHLIILSVDTQLDAFLSWLM